MSEIDGFGSREKNLSIVRDEFVRGFLGEEASSEHVAEAVALLVNYEQELINKGYIELHD